MALEVSLACESNFLSQSRLRGSLQLYSANNVVTGCCLSDLQIVVSNHALSFVCRDGYLVGLEGCLEFLLITVVLAMLCISLLALILDDAAIKNRRTDDSKEQQNQDQRFLQCMPEELRCTCRSKCV